MYCISHFGDKNVFALMDKLGLILDQKDFATNGYAVDEEQHPRTASKASGRKKKVVAPASKEDNEQEEKQDIVVVGGTS